MIHSNLLASVILPIVASLPIYLIKKQKIAALLTFFTLITSGMLLLIELPLILNGRTVVEKHNWIKTLDINFNFLADGLSLPFGLVIVFFSSLVALASVVHLKNGYYFFLLLSVAGMLGLVLSTNLLQFYLFWELMVIPSFFLIGGWGEGDWRIAIKYFLWMRVGGLCLLFGILWLYSLTGSFEIYAIQSVAGGRWIALLFLISFLIKMGVLPFHNWLPDAYSEAPTPISALLSGVMSKTGAYGIIRLVLGMHSLPVSWTFWLSGLGAITMFYGAILALIQTDIKRLLAYGSISQMGLIFFGILSGGIGMVGAMLHTINHAICKGILFLGAGALFHRLGTRNISEMGGLFRKMPITAIAMILAALSLSATPPLSAFVSELIIVKGGLEAGYKVFVGIILLYKCAF